MLDPQRPNKVLRYKPPPSKYNPALDYMNLLGVIFSMYSMMLKLKWWTWVAVYCSFVSFAKSRSSEDTKHMNNFMVSISAVVMLYLQNPQPMMLPCDVSIKGSYPGPLFPLPLGLVLGCSAAVLGFPGWGNHRVHSLVEETWLFPWDLTSGADGGVA